MAGEFIRVTVDVSSIEALARLGPEYIALAMRRAANELKKIIRGIIFSVFSEAFPENKSFPPAYQEHVLAALSKIPLNVVSTEDLIIVGIDLDLLGSPAEFAEGYHYGAMMRGPDGGFGGYVTLPYTGQELFNPGSKGEDGFDKRYEFWKAVVDERPYEGIRGNDVPFIVDTSGMYDETIAARIQAWGDKAPEWLLLEYGTDTYPEMAPADVTGQCYAAIEAAAEDEMEAAAQLIVALSNEGTLAGVGQTGIPYGNIGRFINFKYLE